MRGLREWSKSNYKHPKFLEISGSLMCFQKFMLEHAQIPGHSSFRLLCFRARFFSLASDAAEKSLPPAAQALETLLKEGLGGTLAEACSDKSAGSTGHVTSPDAWLRTPLFRVFVNQLCKETAGQSSEECVGGLLEDVVKAKALMEKGIRHTESVCQDLGHLAAILRCTSAPHVAVAKEVSNALEHFSLASMQQFRAALEGSVAGAGLFLAASCLLQEVAKDWAVCANDNQRILCNVP